ncbi:microcephalin isoform X2 [Phyllopteryx taeniolatus]|uniref:microcephalin isoform X2 n=1 Tax=Phyllopteryx taeniolatus TaxID=161469 RepID=UPI002AD55FFB|nr:microcephalin isoform X2 [Phyllopteryx taeniolatus]
MVNDWLAYPPHSSGDPGSNPASLVWRFHVLAVPAWIFSGYSGFLPHSKNMHGGILVLKMPLMATSNNSTVLQDVVAYVDVWSSDKRANYSKTFIQQLLQMGAQVAKTFNKQVTHVVFNNGHPATWRKAKKSDVKLVSVLWVERCHDDGVLADEELYPAFNDESNPVLKNRKHRCMLPKDRPVRTPENDRRMKKKLDKLMKDMAPKQTLFTDDSPIIIDEDNGIVYSPTFKRSDYMAERLKHMKEKNENISPTGSQMSTSSGVKPSLGNSPTVFSFFCKNSAEDSNATAEIGHSSDKKKDGKESDTTEQDKLDKPLSKDLEKPWLSPCGDISKHLSTSPLKCPDFTISEEEGKMSKKERMASATKSLIEKPKSVGVIQSLVEEVTSTDGKDASKSRLRSEMQSSSSPDKILQQTIDKFVKGRPNIQRPFTELKTTNCPEAVSYSGRMLGDTLYNDQSSPQNKGTRGALSLSALAPSFSLSSESRNVASSSFDEDVFDDFSANHYKKPKRPLLPILPDLTEFNIPSELDYVPKKRKQTRSEVAATESNGSKKRKKEDSKHSCAPQSVANVCAAKNAKESLPAFDHPNDPRTLAPVKLTEKMTTLELEKQSGVCQLSHTFQSRGSERMAAAPSTERPDEGQEKPNKRLCSIFQKISKAKSVRTLVMTSMPTEKQNTVVQVVNALGGFSIANRVCENTTHVVSGECRRTLNILLGIARGCWILSFEWILWCLEQRQWIPEEPYELYEQFPAAQLCRLQKHLSSGDHHQQDLFQNQPPMFVSQHSQPAAPNLIELIQLCGGTVCKTVRQAGICIGKYSGRRPVGSRILSEQWVLDSITNLKQISYDNYDLA